MANNTQKPEENNAIDQINERLTDTSQKIAEHRKTIYWVVGIIVVLGLLIAGYLRFIHHPSVEKSFKAYNEVEIQAGANDSLAAEGYKKVADEYSGDAANLAALEAAEHFYAMGKNEEALKYLNKFSTSDDVLASSATILKGDCNVNMKKYDEAISLYEKAIKECNENSEIAPRAMAKIATVYDAQKKYDKALETYERIAKAYPEYKINNVPVEAYIEREKERLGK